MAFRRLLDACDLPMNKPVTAQVDDVPLCVIRLEDRIIAFVDRCPHRGSPLSEGELDGRTLTCATHRWQFDVDTGKPIRLRAPDRLEFREVRERDGMIEVAA